MRNILVAIVTLISSAALAFGKDRPGLTSQEQAEYSKRENWHTMKMEATAIMGELKYQRGDLDAARSTFHDSLNSSTKLITPGSQVMGLDLYRSAELAARKGDFASARRQLEILLSRYPDTDFARKAEELLALLPKQRPETDDDDGATPIVTAELPEIILSRIQAALKADQDQEALENCREFVDLYPRHKAQAEVRLAAAALYLKLSQPERAAGILKALIAKSADPGLRSRAIHLLGAADADIGDYADILDAVPPSDPAKKGNPWLKRAQLWRAAALDKEGRRAEAASLYAKLAGAGDLRSPVRAYALAGLAASQDALGRLAQAQENIARAGVEAARWGLADLESASRLSAAHLLYRRRLFPQAAAAYADFVMLHPQDPLKSQALYQQGLCLKRAGRRHDAAAAFARLIEETPDSAYVSDAHLQLGQLYDGMGAHAAAVAQYEEMGRSGAKAGAKESLLLRAQVHYNGKRYKDAIPLYWEFLQQDPHDARAREIEELLLTSYWMGDRDDPGLAKAVSLYPDHAIVKHIRWQLAVSAYQRRDYRAARESFTLYAADFPRSPHVADCLFFSGESLMNLHDPDGAAQAYRALLTRFPKDARAAAAAVRLGAALYEAKDFAGSAQAYARLSKGKDRTAADALYSQGVAMLNNQDKQGALNCFERLLARFPGRARDSALWFQIGRLREALGRMPAAAFAYAHVGARDPNHMEALFTAARLREKLGQMALAIRDYEQLEMARPAANSMRLRGLLRLGLLYELKGRPAAAMPLYGEILKLSPHDGQDYDAARRRVEALSGKGLLTSL